MLVAYYFTTTMTITITTTITSTVVITITFASTTTITTTITVTFFVVFIVSETITAITLLLLHNRQVRPTADHALPPTSDCCC